MWPPVLTDDVRLEKPSEKKKTYFLLQLGVKQIQVRHPVIWKFFCFLIIKKHQWHVSWHLMKKETESGNSDIFY